MVLHVNSRSWRLEAIWRALIFATSSSPSDLEGKCTQWKMHKEGE